MADKKDHRGRRRHRRAGRRPGPRHPGRPGRRLRGPRASPATSTPTRRTRLPHWAPRSSRADLDDAGEPRARVRRRLRRLLRHQSSGSTSRPRRRWPRPSNMAHAAKAAGVQHVDLVHARGHAQVGAARRRPHADAAWASTRCRTSTPRARPTTSSRDARRADDVPADVVLLGQLHLLRHGPEARAGRQAGAHAARWATRSCRASPPRTSASAPTASSSAAREFIGKTVGIAGEHLTGARDGRRAEPRRSGEEVRYNAVPPERLPQLRLPRRRRPRQHVPVQARLRRRLLRRPRPWRRPLAQPGAADVRDVARPKQEPHPA